MNREDSVKNENSSEKPPQIRRGRIPSFAIYEISDYELKLLGDGSSASLELNFSLVLLSSSLSFVITLFSAQMTNNTETVFKIVSIACAFIGFYLLLTWYRSRSSIKELIEEIHQRIPANEIDPDKEQSS